jgi:hypothetical protein
MKKLRTAFTMASTHSGARHHPWTSLPFTSVPLPTGWLFTWRTDSEGGNVDCEYDRDEHLRKRLKGIEQCRGHKATDIVPDIMVHHRLGRGRENNLLVIELKKMRLMTHAIV